MSSKIYQPIVTHYEACLEKYGDSHLGVDWPKLEDAEKRYQVMLEIAQFSKTQIEKFALLDLGCGAGHLLHFIQKNKMQDRYDYSGADISQKFIELCRNKFPMVTFQVVDVMTEDNKLAYYDLIVMNGVFTEKRELSFEEMWGYFTSMLKKTFIYAKVGIAFNVMSKQVDWERSDLFHVPHDLLADFLTKEMSRNYVIRNDYGLYEYTVYVYK
jgi:SAM-dependent methyltransferase